MSGIKFARNLAAFEVKVPKTESLEGFLMKALGFDGPGMELEYVAHFDRVNAWLPSEEYKVHVQATFPELAHYQDQTGHTLVIMIERAHWQPLCDFLSGYTNTDIGGGGNCVTLEVAVVQAPSCISLMEELHSVTEELSMVHGALRALEHRVSSLKQDCD
eukprot:s119_g75.t1